LSMEQTMARRRLWKSSAYRNADRASSKDTSNDGPNQPTKRSYRAHLHATQFAPPSAPETPADAAAEQLAAPLPSSSPTTLRLSPKTDPTPPVGSSAAAGTALAKNLPGAGGESPRRRPRPLCSSMLEPRPHPSPVMRLPTKHLLPCAQKQNPTYVRLTTASRAPRP
jgi:hypothetical protein